MLDNISIATNAELKKELLSLQDKFEENKKIILEKYEEMNNLSDTYEKVKDELLKRGGKING